MVEGALRLHPVTLRFGAADIEAAYAEDHACKAVRPVRIALAGLAILVLVYYVVASSVSQQVLVVGGTALLRPTVLMIVGCAVFYAITWLPAFMRRQQLVLFLIVCLMSAGIIRGVGRYPLEVMEARGFVPMLLFTFTLYSMFRLRFLEATAAGWLAAAAYVGYLLGADLLAGTGAARHAIILALANLLGMLLCYQMDAASRREFAAMRLLGEERARSEQLLLNILPAPIAERLKVSGEFIAEHSDGVTVLFADIAGFTPLSARKTPQELVALLNRVFSAFDTLADEHGLEKVKTIGDAYMAVSGLPQPWPDHAARAARMALSMHEAISRIAAETGEALSLRIGLHSGPVVAGVIGIRKFSYDMWGDTVNTASRMESHGVPGAIHCTEASEALLRDAFVLEDRGIIEVKGKGPMRTFLVSAGSAEPAQA
jgi:class 3 adenylate cyclase